MDRYFWAISTHAKLFYARELFTSICDIFEGFGKESGDQRALAIVEYLRGISIDINRTVDHVARIAAIERELKERSEKNGQTE